MKRTLLVTLIMLAIFITPVAFAEYSQDDRGFDDKNMRTPYEDGRMQKERGDKMEAVRENMKERRDDMHYRFDEFKKARIDNLFGMMKHRFELSIDRLENIALRIEQRVKTLDEETDEDLGEARTHLATARKHIQEAKELLSTIVADAESIVKEETKANEKFSEVRELFGKVKTEIRSAHAELVSAITFIKGLRSDDSNTTH